MESGILENGKFESLQWITSAGFNSRQALWTNCQSPLPDLLLIDIIYILSPVDIT